MSLVRLLAALPLLVLGCDDDRTPSPSGPAAPRADAGVADASRVAEDAGTDAGPREDGGPPADGGFDVDAGGDADAAGAPDVAAVRAERYFPDDAVWYRDISAAPIDAESGAVIAWLDGQGWGLGRMQIDFSLEVLEADAAAPMTAFTPTGDFYSPDCDHLPVPVPAGGAIEGEAGYECTSNGDCHLLVAHRASGRLFEMWRANIVGGQFEGGCLAVWDMTRVYGPGGRGENCTSADAAGYPIAPLLVTADEVAAGAVEHALRFILPNARIRDGVYVHPATHSTGAASGPASSPPYGALLRLRGDFPLASLPNDGARVVARALQRYGMFLSDGGNVTLTMRSDRSTTAKWSGLLGPHDLRPLQPSDFEMIEGGARIPYTGDCVRAP